MSLVRALSPFATLLWVAVAIAQGAETSETQGAEKPTNSTPEHRQTLTDPVVRGITRTLNPGWLSFSSDLVDSIDRGTLSPTRLPANGLARSTTSGPGRTPSGELQGSELQIADSPEFASAPDPWPERSREPESQRGVSSQMRPGVTRAFGTTSDLQQHPVQPIPAFHHQHSHQNRMVRYDVPLEDHASHEMFISQGVQGTLMEVPKKLELDNVSTIDRVKTRLSGLLGVLDEDHYPASTKVVRYEVPADDLLLHTSLAELDGEIYEPSMLRLPEVRFFQPKARVYMDLKRENDGEFDLFSNGAVLASLDVVELYMPMPLISDRFARAMGKPSQLSQIGWRVGATLGVGITTALTNTDGTAGAAPISTMSTGLRYDFPLGRPSSEVIETGDLRLDQRTRVGIETGLQGGISSNESLGDSTDLGWYFGILVNTPWTHY